MPGWSHGLSLSVLHPCRPCSPDNAWTDVATGHTFALVVCVRCLRPRWPLVPGRSHHIASAPFEFTGQSVHRHRRSPLAIVGPRGFSFCFGVPDVRWATAWPGWTNSARQVFPTSPAHLRTGVPWSAQPLMT